MKHNLFQMLFVFLILLMLTLSAPGSTPAHAAGGPPFMYIANHDGHNIVRATLGGALDATMTLGGHLATPSGIALDVASNKMYVTDEGNNTVVRADLDGSGDSAILINLSSPEGVALDLTHNKVYVVNGTGGTGGFGNVIRANLDGSSPENLGNLNGTLNFPVAIALDVAGDKMYVANYGVNAISRASLNGLNGTALTLGGYVNTACDIKLDLTNNKMYVVDGGVVTVGGVRTFMIRANLPDGSSVQGLDNDSVFAVTLGLDVPNGKMYVVDNTYNKAFKMNLDGSSRTELGNLGGVLNSPYNMVLDLTVAPPAVTGVSSTTANGSYTAGTTIPITVTFSASVTVTGTPQLALNSGGTASYASGSGSTTLTFNYLVAA